MAEEYGFFNSVNGDRTYNADDWAAYFATFISNGVFPDPANQLQVTTSGTDMTVDIQPGNAFINGYRFAVVDEASSLTIPEADPTQTRIDRIVVRWSRAARRMYLDVLEGTPGSGKPADITQGYETWELCLANITVSPSTTLISAANIEDTRAGEDCGIVAWMVDSDGVDYAAFWKQMEAKFNDWVNQCIAQTQSEDGTTTMASMAIQLSDLSPQTLAGTFTVAGWTVTDGTYQQTVSASDLSVVSGVSTIELNDATEAYIDLDMRNATGDNGTDLQNVWALIGRVYVDGEGIHAVSYAELPGLDLPFLLRVVKKR